jgi:hypothetical protein
MLNFASETKVADLRATADAAGRRRAELLAATGEAHDKHEQLQRARYDPGLPLARLNALAGETAHAREHAGILAAAYQVAADEESKAREAWGAAASPGLEREHGDARGRLSSAIAAALRGKAVREAVAEVLRAGAEFSAAANAAPGMSVPNIAGDATSAITAAFSEVASGLMEY